MSTLGPARPNQSSMTDETRAKRLRSLPSIDALLRTEEARALREAVGARRLAELARQATDGLREDLLTGRFRGAAVDGKHGDDANGNVEACAEGSVSGDGELRAWLLAEAARRMLAASEREARKGLRRVVNATGVVLHTNLGRAPLSEAARRALAREATGYCTLEYDLETGARGRRGGRAEEMLAELTGAEAALVVNNCAAAALLVLSSLSRDGEAIVSRGELVEIGGDFRVPDVMRQSGTVMVEVGTTNRTKISDYRQAISERTRLILRVHPSNYRIVGFTAAPELAELAELAHEAGLPLYEDAGSGALLDLGSFRLGDEPLISESVARGADVVSFSGDKLLGGPQAGLIVGRREMVERLRRNPLYRALRADKLALAALEATLDSYARGAALKEVPALRALSATAEEIRARAERLLARLRTDAGAGALKAEIVEGRSAIGGGSAPTVHPRTALIALTHETRTAESLESSLRLSSPPVIARIAEGRVLLDLRTVAEEEEEEELLAALASIER